MVQVRCRIRASPPREGVALLQDAPSCEALRAPRVRYETHEAGLESWYVCDRSTDSRAEPNCQSLAGAPIDEAVQAARGQEDDASRCRLGARDSGRDQLVMTKPINFRSRATERRGSMPTSHKRPHDGRPEQPPRRRHARGGLGFVKESLVGRWRRRGTIESVRSARIRSAVDDAIRERLMAMTTDIQRFGPDPVDAESLTQADARLHVVEDDPREAPRDGITRSPYPLPRSTRPLTLDLQTGVPHKRR